MTVTGEHPAASAPPRTPGELMTRGQRLRLVLVLGSLIAIGPLTIDMYLPALPSIADRSPDPVGGRAADAHRNPRRARRRPTAGRPALRRARPAQTTAGGAGPAHRRLGALRGRADHRGTRRAAHPAGVRSRRHRGGRHGRGPGPVPRRRRSPGSSPGSCWSWARHRCWPPPSAANCCAGRSGGASSSRSACSDCCWSPWRRSGYPRPCRGSDAGTGGATRTARTYAGLLRDRTFLGLVLVTGLAMAALFAYVSGSSFVYQQRVRPGRAGVRAGLRRGCGGPDHRDP